MKRQIIILLFFLLNITFVFSQSLEDKKNIQSKTNIQTIKDFYRLSSWKFKNEKQKALLLAKKNGWIVRDDKNGVVVELMRVTDDGHPLYYTTYNVDAAKSTRANTLHNGGLLGLNIEGQGMTAHVWDGGLARITHQEYDGTGGNNRFSIGDGSTTLHYHSAHVTGTIIASGVRANAKGMAPQAYAIGYDWNDDVAEASNAAIDGMLLSNHSYGYVASSLPDDMFGQYGDDAHDWDDLMYNAPYYLMCVAAGNDGDDNTSNGSPLDGNSSYDKLSGHATAKNNLVVANAEDANIDANGDLVNVSINSSSSEGPTDDYRIKPDIAGNGTDVYSTYESSDDAYNTITGTSMATPNVTGTLLLLQQYYNSLYSHFMRAATLKGLALHTADDAGPAGPDAVWGWGLLNGKFAAQTIANVGSSSIIEEFILNDGDTHTITVNSDGTNDLIVSISWTDVAGVVNGNLNDNTPALVNDLDMRVTQGGTTYSPYRLTGVTTNGTGDNNVDPYEKIIVGGASGSYTIEINHKNNLTNGSQHYSLIITGISNSAPSISSVSTSNVFKDKGKQITISGSGLLGCQFDLGGVIGTTITNDGNDAVVKFPPGDYSNGTITATSAAGNTSINITVSTRTTIPVDVSVADNSDTHKSIDSAVDGLYAWLGNSAFTSQYIIDVADGVYNEGVTLNQLSPTSANRLIIQNSLNSHPSVNANGNDYGFDLADVDYVTLTGFKIYDATNDNVLVRGNYCNILFNKSYNAGKAGVKIEGGNAQIKNNLFIDNGIYGIHINSSDNTIKNNTLANNGSLSKPVPAAPITRNSGALNDAIPDNGCGSNNYSITNLNVPDNVVITDLIVTDFNITHTWDADLNIYLEHPDGSTYIELSTGNGSSGDNYTDTEFDDDAGTSITAGTAPFTGTYSPEGLLSTFDGMNANGDWTLYVCDNVNGDNGTVDNWSLIISYNTLVEDGAAFYAEGGSNNIFENNIVVAKSGHDDYFALKTENGVTISSDYNTYYTTNTNLFDYNGTVDNTGPMNSNDISSNPLFISSSDYHIQSTSDAYSGGEWPPITATSGTWTTYGSDSPAIDTGNTTDDYSNEPSGNGGRINQGAYGNTVQASKSAATAVTINWTGNSDSNWQNTGNWDSGTIPTSSDDVTIPSGAPNYPIINNGISTVALCNNLTIDAGGLVTIDPNGYMTVTGSITNNEGETGLVINSDDTGTGSLIQNTSGGVDATVNRRLPSSGRQWHMVASPIDVAPLTVFSSSNNLYYYDESTDDYWTGADYDAGSTSGWTTASGNMEVAKGYVYNNFAETLTFTGQLNDNSSTSSISVVYTNNGGTAPNGSDYDDFDGWNFIGNPYTCAIDWDNAAVNHASANLLDAIYCYDDETAHTYTSYVGGVGTNGGTQYIPAMQGFFVKGDNTETSGTLNIGAGALVHSDQAFWKSAYVSPQNLIRLEVVSNSLKDETVVRLTDNATFNMDNGLDAYKMFTLEDDVPQIYTNSNSSTEYSINSLKTIDEGSFSIPLKVIQTDGTFTINISEFTFSDVKVYLKDNLNSETVELGLGDALTFTTDVSDDENRFELVFEKGATNTIQAEDANVTLYPNPNNGTFFLTIGKDVDSYEVSITNVTGQVVYKNTFNDSFTKELNLNSISNGIYFVKITFSDKSLVNKKIIIE